MESTRLTDQPLTFFETFGFLSFPGLLADRIQQITDEFDAIWAANGTTHNGSARSPRGDGRAGARLGYL